MNAILRATKIAFPAAAVSFLIAGALHGQSLPEGYTVPDFTLSPDHRFGVTVPQVAYDDQIKDPKNELIEVKPGHVLATIKAETGWDHANFNAVLPSRWSPDGSLLLWNVAGKWFPTALVLLELQDGAVKWQLNVLKSSQQAILARTKKAKPGPYAAAMKDNAGNGSAYPDGFTVTVHILGDPKQPLSLPLNLLVNLTSNPKEMDDMTNLDAQLNATVDKNGKFTVSKFHLLTPTQYQQSEASTVSE